MSLDWTFKPDDPETPFVPWRRDVIDYEYRIVPQWWNPWTWYRPRWIKVSHTSSGR